MARFRRESHHSLVQQYFVSFVGGLLAGVGEFERIADQIEEAMTQLAPQQAQEQMLLHELNHRINNEFAAVISVVSLTAARADNDDVKHRRFGIAAAQGP